MEGLSRIPDEVFDPVVVSAMNRFEEQVFQSGSKRSTGGSPLIC